MIVKWWTECVSQAGQLACLGDGIATLSGWALATAAAPLTAWLLVERNVAVKRREDERLRKAKVEQAQKAGPTLVGEFEFALLIMSTRATSDVTINDLLTYVTALAKRADFLSPIVHEYASESALPFDTLARVVNGWRSDLLRYWEEYSDPTHRSLKMGNYLDHQERLKALRRNVQFSSGYIAERYEN